MKKLMLAAAAALSATALFATEGTLSSSVVGYASAELQQDGISAGTCFVPVTGEVIDLADLKVTGYDADEGTDSDVEIQTLDEYGRTARSFSWKDFTSKKGTWYGWYEDGEDLVESGDVTFQPGEGLWVYCSDDGFGLQSAGAVPQSDVSVELQQDGLTIANPTPVNADLALSKITGYDEDDGTDSDVELQTLDEYGRTARSFSWKDFTSKKGTWYGWYEDGEDLIYEGDVEILPGRGLWTYCTDDGFNFVWPKVSL